MRHCRGTPIPNFRTSISYDLESQQQTTIGEFSKLLAPYCDKMKLI